GSMVTNVEEKKKEVKLKRALPRNKQVDFEAGNLPALEKGSVHSAHKVIEQAMKVFALDPHVFSIDSDLASTSGLQSGIGFVDKNRALIAGVAEANMMLIGEALGI